MFVVCYQRISLQYSPSGFLSVCFVLSATHFFYFFFFFSSRRRHTRYWRDWSSDVCSSDLSSKRTSLNSARGFTVSCTPSRAILTTHDTGTGKPGAHFPAGTPSQTRSPPRRSEERRVGKECRSRWSPYH